MKSTTIVLSVCLAISACSAPDHFNEKITEINGRIIEREYYNSYGLPQCTKGYDESGRLIQTFLQHYDNDGLTDKTLLIGEDGSALYTEINKKGKFAYQLKFYVEVVPGQAPLLEGNPDQIADNQLLSRPDLINRLLSGSKKIDWVREKDSKGKVIREIRFKENEDTASVEHFHYAESGIMTRSEKWYPVDAATQLVELKDYSPKGLVVHVTKCYRHGASSDTLAITRFEYNEQQLLSREIFFSIKDSGMNYERTLFYTGNKLQQERWTGSGKQEDTGKRTIDYQYNEKGWVISKVIRESSGSGKKSLISYTYRYQSRV